MTRVAVTGAAGVIGTVLAADLERDHEVVRVDRVWRTGALHRRQDTRNARLAARLFDGVDVVIDLAGDPSTGSGWPVVTRQNVPAALGALDGARLAGAARVIYASSSHVTGLYERDEPYASICAGRYDGLDPAEIVPITSTSPLRPDSPYAVGKVAAEAAARLSFEQHGLSALCLRIGTVYAADRPASQRGFATMLSHADLCRLVRACIAAPPEVGFGILYGVSANRWRFWDIAEARRLVGFEPIDDAERWREDHRASARSSTAGTR